MLYAKIVLACVGCKREDSLKYRYVLVNSLEPSQYRNQLPSSRTLLTGRGFGVAMLNYCRNKL